MLDLFREKLEKQTHKYAVSQAIFCPQCGAVMDVKTSISVTVWKDNKLVYSKTFCSTHLQPDYKQAQETLCKKISARAEIYHGKTGKLEIIEG